MQIAPVFGFGRMVSVLVISGLVAISLVAIESAYAKDEDIYSLANHVAKSLSRAHVKTAVLLDFTGADGEVSSLGTFVADRVSEQLRSSKNKFTIVRKNRLMGTNSIKDKQSNSILDAAAQEELKPLAGAVILGEIGMKGDNVGISLHVVDVMSGRIVDHAQAAIRRVMLPNDLPTAASEAETSQVFYSGRDNVTVPQCISCPDPTFSQQARANGRQGDVVFSVLITPAGRATQITVLKMLGDGLDEKAIEAIRTWQFKPGMKDGKPVAVRTPIEVSFRLFY